MYQVHLTCICSLNTYNLSSCPYADEETEARETQLTSGKATNLHPGGLALEFKILVTVFYCLSLFIPLFEKPTAIVFIKK